MTGAAKCVADGELDLRQRRTRAALHAALERLVARMPYSTIGVSLLAQEAEVGRPTFYRHFADVNALLIERLGADLAEQRTIAQRLTVQGEAPRAVMQAVTTFAFQCIATRPAFYRALLDGSAGANASTLFRHQIAELMTLLPLPSSDGWRHNPALTVAMLSGAISGFLLAWIEEGMEQVPSDAAQLLISMIVPSR